MINNVNPVNIIYNKYVERSDKIKYYVIQAFTIF